MILYTRSEISTDRVYDLYALILIVDSTSVKGAGEICPFQQENIMVSALIFERVHRKIQRNCSCQHLKVSGFVKAHHKRIVRSTITGLLETTFVRRVNLPR